MTDERSMLLCSPIAWSPVPPIESNLATCDRCDASVWVSLSLYPRVESGELRTVCLGCLPEIVTSEDLDMRLHPDQIAELEKAGIVDEARLTVALFNRMQQKRPR